MYKICRFFLIVLVFLRWLTCQMALALGCGHMSWGCFSGQMQVLSWAQQWGMRQLQEGVLPGRSFPMLPELHCWDPVSFLSLGLPLVIFFFFCFLLRMYTHLNLKKATVSFLKVWCRRGRRIQHVGSFLISWRFSYIHGNIGLMYT